MGLSKTTVIPKWKSGLGDRRMWTEKIAVIGLALLLSTPLAAPADREMTQEYSACLEKANGITAEMINCMLAETRRQDARLNENYKKLLSKSATER